MLAVRMWGVPFGGCFRCAAGGGVVTLMLVDPVWCLSSDLSDTDLQQLPSVPRWPDQKPVHPLGGVTHHSCAVFADRAFGQTEIVNNRERKMVMLAKTVEHAIGIDPDRDWVTASVVDTGTTGEQASGVFETTQKGYGRLVKWADEHTQATDRAWSVEGAGGYGAGVTSFLTGRDEWVFEFSNPTPSGDGAKTDTLDARRAARQILGRPWPSVPRVRGDREALRVLETTRKGAQTARVAAINELKALVITAPVDLRDGLRGLTTAALVAKCARFRLTASVNEHTATKAAMRSLARRIRTLTTEIAELKAPIAELVEGTAPYLLDQPGIGPITAAQVLIAWSHPGRCRNEAAFARLAGVAPLEASSGQHTRHRLNRRGDRQLNQAIHTIAISRSRYCPKTRAYIAKRTSQGKTVREARRCLKRYIARHLYRLLENPPTNP